MHHVISFSFIALLMSSGIAQGQRNVDTALDIYQIEAARSDIRLLIYRAGMLAQLGHNHVISVGHLKGTINLHPNRGQSSVELEIPVNRLIVDDPVLRREEGDKFSTDPSKADINGTRANMLGKRLLNAKRYPIIKLKGRMGPAGKKQKATLNLSVELLGRVIKLSVPVALRLKGDQLEAWGALSLSHRQLGMTPFKVMLGMLQVADKMDLKYRVRAKRVRD